MREIKFRAWHKIHKTMYRYVEHVSYPDGSSGIGLIGPFCPNNDDVELMQYTGLKDCKGQEIFEGDILKGLRNQYGEKIEEIREVKYDESMQLMPLYDICGYDCELWMDESKYEVIGNIYEHPELLKGE